MRRKDREVTDLNKIIKIINDSSVLRVGYNDNGEVYIVPVNFGFAEREGKFTFYFHGAGAGRKYELSKNGCKVGFELEAPATVVVKKPACRSSCLYRSVIGTGELSLINGYSEKAYALDKIMSHYSCETKFSYEEQEVQSVAVYKLAAEKISCKEKSL